jgi:hypothetical protein
MPEMAEIYFDSFSLHPLALIMRVWPTFYSICLSTSVFMIEAIILGSVLFDISDILLSARFIFGFIWRLIVFLSYSFMPKILSYCFSSIYLKP